MSAAKKVVELPGARIFELRCTDCGRQTTYHVTTTALTKAKVSLYEHIRSYLASELDETECRHQDARVLTVIPWRL